MMDTTNTTAPMESAPAKPTPPTATATTTSTAPAKRERKKVEVFAPVVEEKKEVDIKRGRGTKLADIPNVAFKLSKISRKEDILKFLYRILYKGVPKQQTVKARIGEFSGWVFEADGEREMKVDLLTRAYKDTLHELLDLFELARGTGADGKKEAQVERLAAFLDAPSASGKKSLAEVEEKKKAARDRKRARTEAKKAKAPKRASGGSDKQAALIKKLKAENAALKAKIAKLTGEKEPEAEGDDEDDEEEEEEEEEEEQEEEEEDEDEDEDEDESDSDEEFKASAKKPKQAPRAKAEPTPKPAPKPASPAPAPKPVSPAPAPAASPAPAPAPAQPSSEAIKDAIKSLLKDANMEEVSMKTIRQSLETQFAVSLSERKNEIKQYVSDVLDN